MVRTTVLAIVFLTAFLLTSACSNEHTASLTERAPLTPVDVVREYYDRVARGSYESAWELIHPSEQNHPSSTMRKLIKEQFLVQSDEKQPALSTAKEGPVLDQYKFISTMIGEQNVATVQAEFSNGVKKTLHLLKDEQGHWRVFWNPESRQLE